MNCNTGTGIYNIFVYYWKNDGYPISLQERSYIETTYPKTDKYVSQSYQRYATPQKKVEHAAKGEVRRPWIDMDVGF